MSIQPRILFHHRRQVPHHLDLPHRKQPLLRGDSILKLFQQNPERSHRQFQCNDHLRPPKRNRRCLYDSNHYSRPSSKEKMCHHSYRRRLRPSNDNSYTNSHRRSTNRHRSHRHRSHTEKWNRTSPRGRRRSEQNTSLAHSRHKSVTQLVKFEKDELLDDGGEQSDSSSACYGLVDDVIAKRGIHNHGVRMRKGPPHIISSGGETAGYLISTTTTPESVGTTTNTADLVGEEEVYPEPEGGKKVESEKRLRCTESVLEDFPSNRPPKLPGFTNETITKSKSTLRPANIAKTVSKSTENSSSGNPTSLPKQTVETVTKSAPGHSLSTKPTSIPNGTFKTSTTKKSVLENSTFDDDESTSTPQVAVGTKEPGEGQNDTTEMDEGEHSPGISNLEDGSVELEDIPEEEAAGESPSEKSVDIKCQPFDCRSFAEDNICPVPCPSFDCLPSPGSESQVINVKRAESPYLSTDLVVLTNEQRAALSFRDKARVKAKEKTAPGVCNNDYEPKKYISMWGSQESLERWTHHRQEKKMLRRNLERLHAKNSWLREQMLMHAKDLRRQLRHKDQTKIPTEPSDIPINKAYYYRFSYNKQIPCMPTDTNRHLDKFHKPPFDRFTKYHVANCFKSLNQFELLRVCDDLPKRRVVQS